MDLIADRLVGKELREIQHKAAHDTMIVFEDGAITAWSEVRIEIAFDDAPVIVKELVWSDEWCKILLSAGDIRIGRIPTSPNPECFIYRSASDPGLMIVDRGEE
ncbi:MAG: hypothetical protein LDL42_05835 [Rhizobium sp.]|uniref:hypothetical protein n=1 Tax=Ciceribacter sp. T2.26MG-112.2 TaxID=3137154 RepID=UPI0012B69E42|nr:hypothetical protein [Ciceribacter naphthalenivorans]MCA1968631.1 hypothetical protein [Rhizobium sp.]